MPNHPESANDQPLALVERANRCLSKLDTLAHRVAELRRRAAAEESSEEDWEALRNAELEGQQLLNELHKIEDALRRQIGVSEEFLEALEDEAIPRDEIDRSSRESIAHEQIRPTGSIDDELPAALDRLLELVDPEWLRSESETAFRLGEDFLQEPLCLIRGVRSRSEIRPIHRFAQLLNVCKDLLNEEANYDWFAGATLVPQAVALGRQLEVLSAVSGDTNQRLIGLWHQPSEMTESTLYELLVAAGCQQAGRDIEFLEAGQSGHGERTPDLRVHDYPFPLVIECKRKQLLTEADLVEEENMRKVFGHLREKALERGLTGRFELALDVEIDSSLTSSVIEAAMRQYLVPNTVTPTEYDWGDIAYYPLPGRVDVTPTHLYSPLFLQELFDWNSDLPNADGLICQARESTDLWVSRVRDPIAMVWTNRSDSAFRRRARTASAHFAEAIDQIPSGEAGLVFMCFHEGERPEVADDRIHYFLSQQLHGWAHDWDIRVPVAILTRLVTRPLSHGVPDMIETAFPLISDYGDPSWFRSFPTTVFTR